MKLSKKNIFILIISLLFASSLLGSSAGKAMANTATVSRYYTYYWKLNCYCGNCRWFDSGYVSVVHRVDKRESGSSFKIGQSINFVYNPNRPFFTASGGAWDTPYGAWCSSINSRCGGTWQHFYPVAGGWEGYVLFTAVRPSVYMTSSNPSVIKCSGMSCRAVGPGRATLTAHISKTPTRIWALGRKRNGWTWVSEGHGSWRHGRGPKHWCGCCDRRGNILYLPATSTSWAISVINPTPKVDLKKVCNMI